MEKNIEYYMALPYAEVIEAAAEGGFVGRIPALPGCITQADTRQGILDNLDDAKRCWLETAIAEGIEIPEPAAINNYSGHLNLRMPKKLHRDLAFYAKKEGVSLNQMAVTLLAGGIHWQGINDGVH